MIVLRFILKLVQLFHSETSANSLAAGLAIGLALGFMPLLSLQAVAAIALVLFLRVNVTAALASFLFWKGASFAIAPALDSLGTALLMSDALAGFWAFATNAPVLSLCSLNNSIALAGSIVGTLLAPPAFLACRFLILRYRTHVRAWMARSRLLAFVKGHKLYRLYRMALSPLF